MTSGFANFGLAVASLAAIVLRSAAAYGYVPSRASTVMVPRSAYMPRHRPGSGIASDSLEPA
jgi:hypothetical protein